MRPRDEDPRPLALLHARTDYETAGDRRGAARRRAQRSCRHRLSKLSRRKALSGYPLRLFRRDTIAGIPVIRTWMYPSHGSSRVGRVLNYASFMLSSIAGGLVAGRFDAMYVWHPPLSIGVAAAAITALRQKAVCLRPPGHLAGECDCHRLSSSRLDVQPSRRVVETIRLQACGAHLRRDRGCEGEPDRARGVAGQDHGRAALVR